MQKGGSRYLYTLPRKPNGDPIQKVPGGVNDWIAIVTPFHQQRYYALSSSTHMPKHMTLPEKVLSNYYRQSQSSNPANNKRNGFLDCASCWHVDLSNSTLILIQSSVGIIGIHDDIAAALLSRCRIAFIVGSRCSFSKDEHAQPTASTQTIPPCCLLYLYQYSIVSIED